MLVKGAPGRKGDDHHIIYYVSPNSERTLCLQNRIRLSYEKNILPREWYANETKCLSASIAFDAEEYISSCKNQ